MLRFMNAATTIDTDLKSAVPLAEDAKVMSLVGLAHASSHFGHMLLPPLFPIFMRDFGLSFSQVGLLMTVFFVVSGVGQALAGFVVDRVGARSILFASVALLCAACVLASMATGYPWLIAVAALAGLGNAAFHPVDFTILNQRVSSPRIGHAFSVHGLTGSLGWALAPPFFVLMLWLADWRTAYLAAALLYACVLATLLLHREKLLTVVTLRRADAVALPSDGAGFLKQPVIWWCFAFFMCSTITMSMMQGYSVSLLQAVHHVSFNAATATLTGYMLCGALGTVTGGFVATRFAKHSERVVACCMTAAAASMALASTGALGALGTMVVLAATGLATGIGGPSRDLMVKKATPKGATGRVYGTVYSGFDVGSATAPLLFGTLMDRGMTTATLLSASGVLLLSVGAAMMVARLTGAQSASPAAHSATK